MELYEKLYELRRASGMSQEELAEKLREPERHAPENWLIVTDRFSSRRFRLEELKSITLIVDGQAQELLPKQKGVHQK
mgnify:CR=1 FL=1